MTPAPRALAFLACPPAHFGQVTGRLRAAAPDARWDFVCFYPPPADPGPGVRVLRPVRRMRFALETSHVGVWEASPNWELRFHHARPGARPAEATGTGQLSAG